MPNKKRKPLPLFSKTFFTILGVSSLFLIILSAVFTKITSADPTTNDYNFVGTVGEYCANPININSIFCTSTNNSSDKLVIKFNKAYLDCRPYSAPCPGAKMTTNVNGKTKDGIDVIKHYDVEWVPLDVCGFDSVPDYTQKVFCAMPYFQITVTRGTYP